MKLFQSTTLCFAILAGSVPAHAGLVFVVSYSPAVQANPNFTSIQVAVNSVTTEYSNLFSNNVTVRFTVDQNSSGVGSSTFSNFAPSTYSTIKSDLAASAKSAD